MSFLKRLLISAALVVLIPAVLASAAYAISGQPKSGAVAPRVFVGDVPVGGMTAAQLETAVAQVADDYEDEPLEIKNRNSSTVVNAGNIGLSIFERDTRDAAMKQGRSGNFAADVWSYVGSFIQPRKVRVASTFDRPALDALLITKDPSERTPPVEPRLNFEDGAVKVIEGEAGFGITAATVGASLPETLRHGKPFAVRPKRGDVEPTVSPLQAEAAAATANERLAPLPIKSGPVVGELAAVTYGPWIGSAASDGRLEYVIKASATTEELEGFLPSATRAPVEPRYTVVSDRPVIVPAKDGQRCCQVSALPVLEEAVKAHLNGQTPAQPVELEAIVVPAVNDIAALEALGINERVATFTSRHASGQPRVTNIHRMADTVRGHVIKPGDTLSLNELVGPRTRAKGYVEDAVIADAKFAKSVGGGVSQFASTLFNAAFFGGLDYGEYQSHSIYISRYPYGREATISHPHPDLQIKNTTPHGMLVWTSYTNSSLTVSLYSTPYVTGAQTGQSETKAGVCTRVRTERTRTYVDGRTDKDAVYALYQPEEGVKC